MASPESLRLRLLFRPSKWKRVINLNQTPPPRHLFEFWILNFSNCNDGNLGQQHIYCVTMDCKTSLHCGMCVCVCVNYIWIGWLACGKTMISPHVNIKSCLAFSRPNLWFALCMRTNDCFMLFSFSHIFSLIISLILGLGDAITINTTKHQQQPKLISNQNACRIKRA